MISSTRAQINQLINDKAITIAALAQQLGVSRTQLSMFVADKYTGDNETLARNIKTWLSNQQVKTTELTFAPAYFETSTARTIHKTLQYAQLSESIVVIYGIPGVGKTKSIQYYAHHNPNAWLITASPSRSTLSETLYEIALALGFNDAPKRAGNLSRIIRKKITGSGGILIIDEADHLEYAVLEELRAIQEEAGIGLALVGNDRVYSKLTGGARSIDFARLFSRVAKRVSLHQCRKKDISAVVEAWQLRTDEAALVAQLAEKPGALRIVNQVLRLASMFASGKKEELGINHIRAAIADLAIGDSRHENA